MSSSSASERAAPRGYGVAGSLMGYFGDSGNMLDLTNYVVQALACATWVRFIWKCRVFQARASTSASPSTRYD